MAAFALAACASNEQARQQRADTITQINDLSDTFEIRRLRPLIAQCINLFEGRGFDDAALVTEGYTLRTGLLGGSTYNRIDKRPGIASAGIRTNISHGDNGRDCIISKNRTTSDDRLLELFQNIVAESGYSYDGIERHRLGRRALFSKDDVRLSFNSGSTNQYFIDIRLQRID